MSGVKKAFFSINGNPTEDGAEFFINISSTFAEEFRQTIFGSMPDRFKPFFGCEMSLTENIVSHLEQLAAKARELLTEMEKEQCPE
jgi:hypothetical protein